MPENLQELFSLHGAAATTEGNDPLPLIDPGAVWLVTRGHVDVVAMTIIREEGASDLQRTHLLRIPVGQLLFGFRAPGAGHNVLLLGFGSPGAEVSRMPAATLADAAKNPALEDQIADLVDRWVASVCALCSGDQAPPGTRNLRADARVRLAAGQSAQPQNGVLWLLAEKGAVRFMGQHGAITGDILFPVGKDAWLSAENDCVITAYSGLGLPVEPAYWRGLDAFQDTVDTVIDLQRMRDREAGRRRLIAKSEATRSTVDAAFKDLQSILSRRRTAPAASGGASALLAACRLVGEPLGIDVRDPGRLERRSEHVSPLEQIAKFSRFAMRRVALSGGWSRRDGGPLLGFLDGGETPVALLPDSPRSYALHNVADGSIRPVTRAVAAALAPVAFTFYRCLPDRPLKSLDLLRFVSRGAVPDALSVVALGGLGALLTLATPVAIGHIFDNIVPGAERSQLAQVGLGLVAAAIATGAFQFTRNIALIRLQHRSGTALQAAVWERLVNLPAKFFTNFSAGDLATRAMGVDSMMEVLSTNAITSIVSGVFSFAGLALLFYYSPPVALAATAMVLVIAAVIVVAGVIQKRCQREIEDGHGRMAGMLLQFMNGISKIRIAAAEDRAFGQWASRFADLTRLSLSARRVSNNLDVFNAAFPTLTFMLVFFLIAGAGGGAERRLSTGSFLAFMSAFAALLNGVMMLGTVIVRLLNVAPIYMRMKPILAATPEVDASKADPGVLRGRIEASNISFRYQSDGPAILQGVSFHAEPGEFIALVGPSGSGKSTLLRILLGFEQPESGAIAYDGFDAAGLDPRALRRQLGVVLQDGDLLPGDIFTNIVGSAVDLTQDDAWEAARLAGLAEDIEEMPMGMHTVIPEGAGTLSGGQRQRLMIARALVTKPRIVFFDEATSALDNPTQAVVTQSLDRLRATRIVIAHRLSTIVGADRIYVLERGRMVQSGTYEELIGRPGLFHELVKRQIA